MTREETITKLASRPTIEILKDEAALISTNPLLLVEHGFLKIKVKEGDIIELRLNSVQEIIVGVIKKLQKEKKPVRLLILKARQVGTSTVVEGIIYGYVTQREGINAMVIADDIKGANYIFDMQKIFYEGVESHLKPKIKHSNEKKLEFLKTHSQVMIDTSENPNLGHKYTLQYAHLTEVTRFRDLRNTMNGIMQAVPNIAESMVVLETTARGVGEPFYDMWCEAVGGKSDWVAVFIPWYHATEYILEVKGGVYYPIENIKEDKGKFLKEEIEIREKYKLSDGQINWRRWCIVNNCGGDINIFREQYPATWQEAFIMSGNLYFDRESLLRQEEKGEKVKIKGWPKVGDIVRLDGKYIFRESEDGKYRIFEYPEERKQYSIGADAAEGLSTGDNSAIVGINNETNRTVFTYSIQSDADELIEDLIKVGNYYNQAMIAPENKGYGTSVCKGVYKHYGNVYRKVRDNTGQDDVTNELGWNTNAATRPRMLEQLREEIKEGSTDLLDSELLAECRTFIVDAKKKKAQADKGKHDDLVMARAIAGMVRYHYPYVRSYRREEYARRPILANQGYGFSSE